MKPVIKLGKMEQKLVDQLDVGTQNETVTNPFTGRSRELEPLAVALYDFIIGWSNSYTPPEGSSIREFDCARGLFRKNWPSEYMDLLD
jgi:hypothetical protein